MILYNISHHRQERLHGPREIGVKSTMRLYDIPRHRQERLHGPREIGVKLTMILYDISRHRQERPNGPREIAVKSTMILYNIPRHSIGQARGSTRVPAKSESKLLSKDLIFLWCVLQNHLFLLHSCTINLIFVWLFSYVCGNTFFCVCTRAVPDPLWSLHLAGHVTLSSPRPLNWRY